MSKKNHYDNKHLTTTQRIKIEKGLNDGKSMAEIGRIISKHPTTVSKKVKKYRTFHMIDHSEHPLRCALFKECSLRFLCEDASEKDCVRMCKHCYDVEKKLLDAPLPVQNTESPSAPGLQRHPMSVMAALKQTDAIRTKLSISHRMRISHPMNSLYPAAAVSTSIQ